MVGPKNAAKVPDHFSNDLNPDLDDTCHSRAKHVVILTVNVTGFSHTDLCMGETSMVDATRHYNATLPPYNRCPA